MPFSCAWIISLNKDQRRKEDPQRIMHKVAYRCSWIGDHRMHSKKSVTEKCKNPEVLSHLLETCVIEMIKTTMTDPFKLKKCLKFANDKSRTSQWRMEKKLKDIDQKIKDFAEQKKLIIDAYASGQIDRATYAERCQNHDKEAADIRVERAELINRIPILHKKDIVGVSVGRYCESVKTRFEICNDQEFKREFMKDYVEEVIYNNTNVTLRGSVPIKLKVYEDPDQPSEVSKIGFTIESQIKRGNKWHPR